VAFFVILCAKKATAIITKNGNKFIDRRNWIKYNEQLVVKKSYFLFKCWSKGQRAWNSKIPSL